MYKNGCYEFLYHGHEHLYMHGRSCVPPEVSRSVALFGSSSTGWRRFMRLYMAFRGLHSKSSLPSANQR